LYHPVLCTVTGNFCVNTYTESSWRGSGRHIYAFFVTHTRTSSSDPNGPPPKCHTQMTVEFLKCGNMRFIRASNYKDLAVYPVYLLTVDMFPQDTSESFCRPKDSLSESRVANSS